MTALPSTRRFSICPPRPLWIGMATAMLSLAAAVAGDPADEEPGENAPLAARAIRINELRIDLAREQYTVAIRQLDAVAARKQLDTVLRQRVAVVDTVCGLNDMQKQKLELAGRGDVKRFIDRAQEIAT